MKYTKTVRASKKVTRPQAVRASRSFRRAVKAEDEIIDEAPVEAPIDAPAEAPADVTVDEEASVLLFEAEDVAELISDVAGLPVDVTVDDTEVVFTVGDDEYTVTPEGDEEVLEASTKMRRPARKVSAARRMPARRPAVKASTAARSMPARRASARKAVRK